MQSKRDKKAIKNFKIYI